LKRQSLQVAGDGLHVANELLSAAVRPPGERRPVRLDEPRAVLPLYAGHF
jgi:hypothetical protein